MDNIRHITALRQISELTPDELRELQPVERKFVFRSNTYYDALINWSDPSDPLRKLIIPTKEELADWGSLDASDEGAFTKVPGLEHKYKDTALLLVSDVCAAYCRFCFRKRLFLQDNEEVVKDLLPGLEYIKEHQEISNVLLTGGDPLVMSTSRLKAILVKLRDISHVKIIRIGTKVPAFNPDRISRDRALIDLLQVSSASDRKIYIMAHFTHPRELTIQALTSIETLQRAGTITANQTPLISGINDKVDVLADLLNRLSFIGVAPYYVFQCRPTLGNKPYLVPLEASYQIFAQVQARCSGLAGRARFVMSHASGKIEVLAVSEGFIFMKYHRAAAPADENRLMVFPCNRNAYWFDDYIGATKSAKDFAGAFQT